MKSNEILRNGTYLSDVRGENNRGIIIQYENNIFDIVLIGGEIDRCVLLNSSNIKKELQRYLKSENVLKQKYGGLVSHYLKLDEFFN